MNELFYVLGIESWKHTIESLLLPPVPLLLLVLAGAVLLARRRTVGGWLLGVGCVTLYLSTTPVVADALGRWLNPSPPVLSAATRTRLKAERTPRTAIVVLGGGRRERALEYGTASPGRYTIERLRYGLWLARQTALPVAYTGGIAHGGDAGASEAEVAQRVAREEFGLPLRWAEGRSRDTFENARFTVPLMREAGVERLVLVTHAFHMRRVMRAFERAAAGGTPMQLIAAPIGVDADEPLTAIDWLPSSEALGTLRVVLHEWLGHLAGA